MFGAGAAATLQKVVSCCPCLLSLLFFPSGLWRSELSVPRTGLRGAVSAPERLPARQQGRGCKSSRPRPGVSHTGVPRPGSSHGTRGCATGSHGAHAQQPLLCAARTHLCAGTLASHNVFRSALPGAVKGQSLNEPLWDLPRLLTILSNSSGRESQPSLFHSITFFHCLFRLSRLLVPHKQTNYR